MAVAHSSCYKLFSLKTSGQKVLVRLHSNVPHTSSLFQQTALSNHGRFKPDLHLFLYNGTLALWKSTFGRRQARLGGVRVTSVSIVAHNLIDIPAQKFVTFCYVWTDLHDLYIGG